MYVAGGREAVGASVKRCIQINDEYQGWMQSPPQRLGDVTKLHSHGCTDSTSVITPKLKSFGFSKPLCDT